MLKDFFITVHIYLCVVPINDSCYKLYNSYLSLFLCWSIANTVCVYVRIWGGGGGGGGVYNPKYDVFQKFLESRPFLRVCMIEIHRIEFCFQRFLFVSFIFPFFLLFDRGNCQIYCYCSCYFYNHHQYYLSS